MNFRGKQIMNRKHGVSMHNIVTGRVMLAALFVLGTGPARAAGDPAKGQQVYQSQCAACHSVSPGVTLFGPSLAAVYGKPAAGVAGYSYSPALTKAHLVWNAAALDKFLTAPQTVVPGTKMPFAGLSDPQQRQDVIAYLAQLAQGGATK
jgi:cytochrome c